MNIKVHCKTKALNVGHCACAGRALSETGLMDQSGGNAAGEDPQYFAHEIGVRDKQETQLKRHSQHPLLVRITGQNLVQQQSGAVDHPSGRATGAEAASFQLKATSLS